jgi:dienelactone hydrolase
VFVRTLLGVAVAAVVLAGCSSSSHPKSARPTTGSPSTASSSTVSPANPKLNARCPDRTDGISATPFTFAAGDGTKLTGLELGRGAHGVVMVHELGDQGLCGWLPYGKYLADAGLHVLLYDTRCAGSSTCPDGKAMSDVLSDVAGAKAELERRGARDVAVVGASFGGAIALASAVTVRGLRACVDLSGDLYDDDLGQGLTGRKAAPRLAIPLYYAVASGDSDRLPTARGIVARIKPSLVTLRVLSGYDHGWDLLRSVDTGKFTPLAAQVLAFLNRHLR